MSIPKSSGWFIYRQYLIRMTNGQCIMSSGWVTILPYLIRWHKVIWTISHPDELARFRISSGWLGDTAVCHPGQGRSVVCFDVEAQFNISSPNIFHGHFRLGSFPIFNILKLRPGPLCLRPATPLQVTYECVLCHPDETIMLIPKSSGWLSYRQYLIRLTYGQCIMSSGWHTKLT